MNQFGVIFDMDGTLIDSQRIFVPSWEQAGRKQGIIGMGTDDLPLACGMNDVGWKAFLMERHPNLDLPTFIEDVRAYNRIHGRLAFMPGAEELLRFLHEKGVPMAIASGSCRAEIIDNMTKLGVLDLFDVLVGGEEVTRGKPEPDIFLLAAQRLGIAPQDCFVVEDSQNGVRSACAAETRCIGVPDVAVFSEEVKGMLFAEAADLHEVQALLAAEMA